jgi:hypothetical protein
VGDQNKFIDSAIGAGVKRFIPSEFGTDPTDARVLAILSTLGNSLKSNDNEMSWSSFIKGPFFGWGRKVGFMGLHFGERSATILENGTTIFSAIDLQKIALYIIKALEKPEVSKGQYMYCMLSSTSENRNIPEECTVALNREELR